MLFTSEHTHFTIRVTARTHKTPCGEASRIYRKHFATVGEAMVYYWQLWAHFDDVVLEVAVVAHIGHHGLMFEIPVDPMLGEPVSDNPNSAGWAELPAWIRRAFERHGWHHHRWNDYDGPMYA